MDIESLIAQLAAESVSESMESSPKIIEDSTPLQLPKIKVIGIGGAGNNFVTALFERMRSSKIVETLAINTDASQLSVSKAHQRILIGRTVTRGYGAGNDPILGRKAFEESREQVEKLISDADLVVVVSGLGGGTGSGAAPALLELTSELGILSIAFLTLPFKCEGRVRIRNALEALSEILRMQTVTVIVPNERLAKVAPHQTMHSAFSLAGDLFVQSMESLEDLIIEPGLINVDFADVCKVLSYKGIAVVGVASLEKTDQKRATEVAEKILNNPLLDINPALGKSCLMEIVGGEDLTLSESYDIVNTFTTTLGEDKEIIFGLRILPQYKSKIRVFCMITGIDVPLGNFNNSEEIFKSPLGKDSLLREADVDTPSA
ncbi:MAG: cell division protein FtsZ [Crenarchaeota archaeon]|nr:cell division protein FtsZ [Thermoproteota archaeon]MCR8453493.1 cell division protein FtsZ [Thermoproteota archaeon]MCR8462748.1 cell division protein FtsZ [Thermoproteota archaeon]MCR8471092.1 cell division protein FtsZ [Thermoproteota archaeon]MCR8471552.1 cell division protein FtsZ [Thermoproteota archaeon]